LKGQLTVHCGDSKHGKSVALTQIACSALEQDGVVCIWSGEDDEHSFKYRLDVHIAGYEGTEIKTSHAGREYAALRPEFRERIDRFLRGRMYLYNKRTGVTEDRLVECFELARKRHGCDVFIVDNLMKMVAARDTQQIFFRQAQIINKLSDFAKDNNVHVHIATHINKGGTQDIPPSKNDVSGAKEITNLADIVLAWWRVPVNVKALYENRDAVCGILANRVFGDEVQANLFFDWRVKRFAEEFDELGKRYL